jgi:hypothetical protein
VLAGANKTGGAGIGNVLVLLLDANGNPVAYTYTASDGSYSFANIPTGSLQVQVEWLNKTAVPVTVNLTTASPAASGIDFEVGKTTVTPIESASFLSQLRFTLAPNPAQERVQLIFALDQPASFSWLLADMLGRTLSSSPETLIQPAERQTVDCSALASGVYRIHLYQEGQLVATRLLTIE